MRRRRAILDPTNVQDCLIKVGLLPTKIDKLGRAEPVPESDQDHRRVTVALPIVLGRLDEALDLCRRQVLAGPQLPIGWTPGRAALRYCAVASQSFIASSGVVSGVIAGTRGLSGTPTSLLAPPNSSGAKLRR